MSPACRMRVRRALRAPPSAFSSPGILPSRCAASPAISSVRLPIAPCCSACPRACSRSCGRHRLADGAAGASPDRRRSPAPARAPRSTASTALVALGFGRRLARGRASASSSEVLAARSRLRRRALGLALGLGRDRARRAAASSAWRCRARARSPRPARSPDRRSARRPAAACSRSTFSSSRFRNSSSCPLSRFSISASCRSASPCVSFCSARSSPSMSPIFFISSATTRFSCGKRSAPKPSSVLVEHLAQRPQVRRPARPAPSPGRRRRPSRAGRRACAPARRPPSCRACCATLRARRCAPSAPAIFCARSAMRARRSRASRSSWRRSAGILGRLVALQADPAAAGARRSARLPERCARSSSRCRPIRSSSSSTSFSSSAVCLSAAGRPARQALPARAARRLAAFGAQRRRLLAQHVLQPIGDPGQRAAQRLAQRPLAPIVVEQPAEQRQVRLLGVVQDAIAASRVCASAAARRRPVARRRRLLQPVREIRRSADRAARAGDPAAPRCSRAGSGSRRRACATIRPSRPTPRRDPWPRSR